MLHSLLLVGLLAGAPEKALNNPLWHMINQDYDDRALGLIKANPELINRTRINYGPPLLIAVQKKNFKIVKALVEAA